jgi:hypothetical protein
VFFLLFLLEFLFLFSLSRQLTRGITALLHQITNNQHLTIWILSLLFLPGVVIHEFAHAIMAIVLFVPVGEMEFMPKVKGDMVKMGSVAIGKSDMFRRAFIGLAPMLLGIVILGALGGFYVSQGYMFFSWWTLLVLYIAFQIGNTLFSSGKDVEGMGTLLALIFFLLVTGFIFTKIANIQVSLADFPWHIVEFPLIFLCKIIGIIIAIDLIIIGLLSAVRR